MRQSADSVAGWNAAATAARRWPAIGPEAAVFSLIVVTALLRVWALANTGLGFGESYHFSCAIRPSLSYFDHPPLAVLLAHLSMHLAGDVSALIVRLPFILLFAGTTWLTFAIGRRLFGPWPGVLAAVVLNLSPVFTLSTAGFLQSDGPLMFFWLACVACLARVFFDVDVSRPIWWWAAVGVTLGLAMLSKYHAVFLIFGAGMVAMTQPEQRRWIFHPGPYLAMGVAAAIFSPVLWWNYQHDWISFLWQGNRGLESQGLRIDWLFRCIGGQALWLLPWIWAPLVWELILCFRAGRRDRERWFVVWLAVAPIVLFTTVSAYASIGFHFHWQAPGYLLLFLPLGATLWERLQSNAVWTRRWLFATSVFSVIALTAISTHTATGWWDRIGPQWLSEKFGEPDDPTLECLDFAPLYGALDDRGLLDQKDLFLFTNRWFQSGKVDYALKGSMPVFCFHPDARSFAFFGDPEAWVGKDGILVTTNKFCSDPDGEFGKYFTSIEPLGAVELPRGGRVVETLHLYRCREMHTPFALPYR